MSDPFSATLAPLPSGDFKPPTDISLRISEIPITSANSFIYRLYQAAFARIPDDAGFSFWVGKNAEGLPTSEMATYFRNSSEFQQKYGVTTNNQYVYTLYKNVLGREPDAEGLQFWQDNVSSGAVTRDAALVYFADSPENIKLTAQSIDNGYWVV